MIPKESFTLLSHPLSLLFSSLLFLFLFSSISHPSKHLTQPKPKKTRKKTKHSAIINPLKWLPIIIANTQSQKCFLVSSHAPQKKQNQNPKPKPKKKELHFGCGASSLSFNNFVCFCVATSVWFLQQLPCIAATVAAREQEEESSPALLCLFLVFAVTCLLTCLFAGCVLKKQFWETWE